MISEKSFLSGYLHCDRNLHSKFKVSSFNSFGNVNFASCDLDGFSSVDDDILTTETLTAEDILTEVKNQQNSASDEKNLQEEEDIEEQEIEVNVATINEPLQVIRVVHNFYEATTENVQ